MSAWWCGLLLLLWVLVPAGASAQLAPVHGGELLSLRDLGYENDVTMQAGSGTFSLFIPALPQLKALHVRFPLRVSPIAQDGSSATLTVNGVPIRTVVIGAHNRNPVLEADVPAPTSASVKTIELAISAHLYTTRNNCQDDANPHLWTIVPNSSTVRLSLGPAGPQYIADWLRDYTGRYNVVLQNTLSQETRRRALWLPYVLQQVQHWRPTTVALGTRIDPDARNVIVGDFATPLELRHGDLLVGPSGIGLLTHATLPLLLTRAVTAGGFSGYVPPAPDRTISLAQLGVPTQTRTGSGEITFTFPFNLSEVNGKPENLQFLFGVTHAALESDEHAVIRLAFNTVLVRSYVLGHDGTQETFEAPIEASLIRASNTVKVTIDFSSRSVPFCARPPDFTASLLDSSAFTWTGVKRATGGIGDFFQAAHGKLGVLLGSDDIYPDAFALLSKLGSVNASVQELDVRRFEGTLPDSVDEQLVVGPPDRVEQLNPELNPNGSTFVLLNQNTHQVLFRANYIEPFALIETIPQAPVPTIVATYWRDHSVLSAVEKIPARVLSAQQDTVMIFNRDYVAYGPVAAVVPRLRAPLNAVAIVGYSALGLAVLLIAGVIFMGTRTARKARQSAAGNS